MKRRKADLICVNAEAYALGALESEEARAFAEHLERGCPPCAAALGEYDGVLELLGQAAGPVSPRAAASADVLAKIRGADPAQALRGQEFVRRGDRDWAESGVEGVQLRLLAEDRQSGRRTFMVRMRDGAALPRHRHEGVEEIFLIEGHLSVSGVDMRGGDYCRSEGGTVHEVAVSRGGCVFLVNGSTGDRVLAND